MGNIRLAGLAAIVVAMVWVAPAAASPYVHAHRGGDIEYGAPSAPENTMSAFRISADRGFVLEMDVKLTSDNVPVVIHDATLNRTTTCTGQVAEKTLAELSGCQIDVIGSDGNSAPLTGVDPEQTSIPTLSQVLELIRQTGASANIEIKNLPTDPDWDPTLAYADTIAHTIQASNVPSSQLIIQSFWPDNLVEARKTLPDVEYSYLTPNVLNGIAIGQALDNGFQWVSPEWPVDQAFVASAHDAGFRVVPWTLDTSEEVRAATQLGVDALITNDPLTARKAVADENPIDTTIESGPTGIVTTDKATFTFSGVPAKDTVKLQCSIDDGPFSDCTSPKTFAGLTDGSHTASFRAGDAAGNQDETPATSTFKVDTRARISKVKVNGPGKIKKGKKATYRIKIRNSGNGVATAVRLKVSGRGISFKTQVGKIQGHKTRTAKITVKARKPGRVKATFKVKSSNAGGKTVKKKITVKK